LALRRKAGGIVGDAQDALERDRRLAARHLDGEEVGGRAADRIGAQDRVVDDRRGIDEHGLDADVEPPASRAAERGFDRARNSSKIRFCSPIGSASMRLSQRWIGGSSSFSTPSLSQSSRPVRSSNSASVVLLSLPGAGGGTSSSAPRRHIAFQIVGRVEEILSAGLALPGSARPTLSRRRAIVLVKRSSPLQSVVTGRNRACRPDGCDGCAQTLDRPVGPPAGFEQEMGPLLLVHRVEARMIGAARPARVAEDEDALEAAHEGGGLGLAGSGRAGLELLAPVARLDQPLCASRDLGDIVMAEMIEQPVERGGNRRQRAKLLDEIDARAASACGL
jgi:hypothetical protein